MKRSKISIPIAAIAALFLTSGGGSARPSTRPAEPATEPLEVVVNPVGPSPELYEDVKKSVLALDAVRQALRGSRFRLLNLELQAADAKDGVFPVPSRYQAVIYDYTRNRTLSVTGPIDKGGAGATAQIALRDEQPLPNDEEFQEAVDRLKSDPEIGPALVQGRLVPYQPMPPMLMAYDKKGVKPLGGLERTIHVGLAPTTKDARSEHEIVGVNLTRNVVTRYRGGAPRTAVVNAAPCAPFQSSGGTNGTNVTGYELVVTRSGNEIWRFTVQRPAVSSGSSGGSAIDLTNINYRGKRVLARAHTPVLNVKYNGNVCGPYRDWQNSENAFVANGTDVPSPGSGIRNCTSRPETILENGTDAGNFKGVAYYVGPDYVVLVTELQAGWYRYVAEWTFLDNGTIKPRFGFGAVSNSCVCNPHLHHVYWRFDFDIGGAANNSIYESDQAGNWNLKSTETTGRRDRPVSKKWLIQNNATRDAYMVVPGANDGIADTYGRGDHWLLLNKGVAEYGDGGCFSCAGETEVRLSNYVNSESIAGQDIVFWYGGHSLHNHDDGFSDQHYVGPDLVVSAW